ncbi:PLP-dependent transferase [Westerdykella ornata]|uniref:aromatic-amino-acid transaminase n=1 Tax=Westerdykella ornata TaxID=318751 RepID=A0A6A6JZU4_WESOR|nr:PLP-dependent transferase [Westerdykella ornata]KAF2281306.1 PLP-dependent transferase [Westerdykella ornata]
MAPPAAIEVNAVTDTTAITLPDPLKAPIPKSNDIYGRRRKADKSQWGTAAPADSANFRQGNYDDKPMARRWDHYLSNEARTRKGNNLKKAARFLGTPGLISLGGGLPSSEYFPFEELSIKVPTIGHFSEAETRESGVVITAGKNDLANDKSIFDIATAFNYGQGCGAAQLLRWITEHTELVHRPPYQDWRCTMSIGSTSGLDMAFRMLSRPGDMVLSEDYTFAAAVETALPMGLRLAGVPMDEQGLLPEAMDHILSTWDVSARGARKPHLLYTVPTGQNPTGATQSAERRREIYKVCQKHDIYIIEDEPYYFLQMAPYTSSSEPDPPQPSSHAEFLASLVPSFLSLDTDGRVMRLDSFSKVISPGSRIGWITASQQIVACYQKHADLSTQNPSGMSQLIVWKLLDEHWGHAGYLDWLIFIRKEYTRRRNVILGACEKYLPREVVSWKPPMAGMFHWMQIDYTKHPDYRTKTVEEIEESIFMRCIEEGALVMRGSWFYADPDEEHSTMFFRATYAAAEGHKIEEGVRRVGRAVRREFGLEE